MKGEYATILIIISLPSIHIFMIQDYYYSFGIIIAIIQFCLFAFMIYALIIKITILNEMSSMCILALIWP